MLLTHCVSKIGILAEGMGFSVVQKVELVEVELVVVEVELVVVVVEHLVVVVEHLVVIEAL